MWPDVLGDICEVSQLFLFVSVDKYCCVYLFLNHGHRFCLTCGLKIIFTIFVLWENVAWELSLGIIRHDEILMASSFLSFVGTQ